MKTVEKKLSIGKRGLAHHPFVYLVALAIFALVLAACGSQSAEPESAEVAAEVEATESESEAEEGDDDDASEADEAEPTEEPEEEAVAAEPAVEPTDEPAEEVAAEEPEEEMVAPNVFFKMPTDNAIVPTTFSVVMGSEGVAVDPAGDILENSGHMHILVDTDFIEAGNVIPKDDQHIHYGDASIMTELELAPGSHTIRLQMANGAHIALEGDEYRDTIVVTVQEDAPEQAVRFAAPLDGAVVPTTVDVSMAAVGMMVEPSGDIMENSGHMHILVDTDFVAPGEVIIKDEQHIHFGGGQLAATLELTPGEHTLRLQVANGAHIALDGDQYRDEIVVTVAEDASAQSIRFVQPEDGATIDGEFAVQMSAAGLFVEAAGAVMRTEGGHMHILVDTDFIEAGNVIPKDDQHIHFGGGQTITDLALESGEHTLRLQMGNGAHIALEGDQYRDEITITVGEGSADARDNESEEVADAESDGDEADEEGDAEARSPQELWTATACSACHNLDEAQSADNIGQPGPHMGNLHETAGDRVDGQSALEYVVASIVAPNDFVNEGYVASVMPQNFAEQMSEVEITSLAEWMLDPARVN